MHRIKVVVDGQCNYGYSENPARSSPNSREIFQWYCPTGDLTITFPAGNPFNNQVPFIMGPVHANQPTPPQRVLDDPTSEGDWKYIAKVDNCPEDDPIVIIDSGNIVHPSKDFVNELFEKAEAALSAVLRQVQDTDVNKQGAPSLFAQGVDSVSVDVGTQKVSIRISGPRSKEGS